MKVDFFSLEPGDHHPAKESLLRPSPEAPNWVNSFAASEVQGSVGLEPQRCFHPDPDGV
jgi:hypothetical protein